MPRVLGSMADLIIFPSWKRAWPPEHEPVRGPPKVEKTLPSVTWLDVESELK